MSGRHAVGLERVPFEQATALHRLAPEAKLIGLLLFVAAVACTPRTAIAAFVVDAAVLAVLITVARVPATAMVRRFGVIVPFFVVAAVIPVVASGERRDVLGASLSVDGLWASWNIVAKTTLGATATLLMSSTTTVAQLVAGMSRLRLPRLVVAIVAFMLRSIDELLAQVGRMRRSMVARAHDPRWLWQARPMAASAGALFVRAYERGERTHQAMLARGYDGTMPDLDDRRAAPGEWAVALLPGSVAALALAVAAAR
jgi:cobalt/nickel transport system permease protein